jgi:hypothetical protein
LVVSQLKLKQRRESEMAKSKASGYRAAGGIGSKNVVRKPVRTGAGAKAAHKAGVAQLGQHVGDHVTKSGATGYRGEPLYGGAGYNPVKYGNEVALNVGGGGAGKGRTVYKSGSQQGLQTRSLPTGRDTLGEFGPEAANQTALVKGRN